jgi:hypothetical protein
VEFGRLRILPVYAVLLSIAIGCHDKDPALAVCRPHSLQFDTDSAVYRYDDNLRISTVLYYASGQLNKQDDFGYSSFGLSTVAKSSIMIDGTQTVDSYHTIDYDMLGFPSTLITESASGHYKTTFTHDFLNRLTEAKTTYGSQNIFVGSTRYEYDDNDNVPKVYYTINFNQKIQEVLARENLSFDDKEKFYVNVPELKIVNEYVYGYLPNKNNCLGSKVYFFSYQQHFVEPLSVSFSADYNDQGLIKTLRTEETTQLYSGEELFNKLFYNCD